VKRITAQRSNGEHAKRGESHSAATKSGKPGRHKIVNLLARLRHEPYTTKTGDALLKKILADDPIL
jgi:hypothetical protein